MLMGQRVRGKHIWMAITKGIKNSAGTGRGLGRAGSSFSSLEISRNVSKGLRLIPVGGIRLGFQGCAGQRSGISVVSCSQCFTRCGSGDSPLYGHILLDVLWRRADWGAVCLHGLGMEGLCHFYPGPNIAAREAGKCGLSVCPKGKGDKVWLDTWHLSPHGLKTVYLAIQGKHDPGDHQARGSREDGKEKPTQWTDPASHQFQLLMAENLSDSSGRWPR